MPHPLEVEIDPDYLLEDWAVPIHTSLMRPVLLWGAERRLAFFTIFLVFVLVVGFDFRLTGILIALVFGALFHWWTVWLAGQDPYAAQAYVKSRHYKDYYPARAEIDAPPQRVPYEAPRR